MTTKTTTDDDKDDKDDDDDDDDGDDDANHCVFDFIQAVVHPLWAKRAFVRS